MARRVSPFDVADKRYADSRSSGNAASSAARLIVAAKRNLCSGVIRRIAVVGKHPGLATQLTGVVGGAAKNLGPPPHHVGSMLLTYPAREQDAQQVVTLNTVMDGVARYLLAPRRLIGERRRPPRRRGWQDPVTGPT